MYPLADWEPEEPIEPMQNGDVAVAIVARESDNKLEDCLKSCTGMQGQASNRLASATSCTEMVSNYKEKKFRPLVDEYTFYDSPQMA